MQRHSDWAPGEPGDTNGEEDCVFMWKKRGYRWNDDRCSNLKPYVCKTRAKVRMFDKSKHFHHILNFCIV